MKKKILGIVLLSVTMLGQPNVLAVEDQKPKENAEQVIEKQAVSFKNYTVTQSKINIEGSGMIILGKVNGVQLEGKFVPKKNEFIELKEDGSFTGLKAGKTKVSPVFILTDSSFKELKTATEKAGTINNTVTKEIKLKEFPIEVSDKKQVKLPISADFSVENSNLKVGETTKISVNPIHGVSVDGDFKEQSTPKANLKDNGQITALKAGEEKMQIEFNLSDASKKKIKHSYIAETKQKDLKEDDITLIEDNNKQLVVKVFEEKIEETKDSTQSSSTTSSTSSSTDETTNTTTEEKVNVSVTTEYTFNKNTLKVNETGILTIKPIYGVTPKGEYKVIDNGIVKIDATGNVTGLKEGKTTINPEFTISEASKKEIKQNYIKESGNSKLKEENINLVITNQSTDISINVEKKTEPKTEKIKVDVTPNFKTNQTNLKVGQTSGKVTVDPIQGVQIKGKFKPVKHEMFEMKEDGTFVGLKAGKVELVPIFEISKESLDAIADVVLKQKGNEGKTRNDVEFITRDISQIINLEFTATSNNNNNSNNNNKQYVPAKKYEPVKTLPQTGESKGIILMTIGSLMTLGSIILLKLRIK